MYYRSTRNRNIEISAAQAIARGLSGDGGLFVPERFPRVSLDAVSAMEKASYVQRAAYIMSLFLTDFSHDEVKECVSGAYTQKKFPGKSPAPLSRLGSSVYFLELWHGPTCAFKDMALQILPRLLALQILPRFLTKSLKKISSGREALILTATSGDTGKAALEGFRDVPGTHIMVFYPCDGVSEMQKRQMCTQEGGNLAVCAVKGNFDDTQTGVKHIFNAPEAVKAVYENGMMFSSANSINWGRLLPQIVYYFSAYCDIAASGGVKAGEPVNIAVPTGNFGDILAAYYAKKMGLPVKKLICASNSNNVLTDFLKTGIYDRNRQFYETISPSMDILVSSNLERLLFDLTDGDDRKVSSWMRGLSRTGSYDASKYLDRVKELFWGAYCDDAETKQEIRRVYEKYHYLCDTHTAVASAVYGKYAAETGDSATPAIVVSTANPYKFPSDVLDAVTGGRHAAVSGFEAVRVLSEMTGTPVPEPIAELEDKPVRFGTVCAKEEMGAEVLKFASGTFE